MEKQQKETTTEPVQSTPAVNDTATQPQTNGMAIASLVLGIISVIFCWIPFASFGGQIFPILGFIFGIIGINKKYQTGRGMAIAGIVTSSIAFVVESIWLVILIVGAIAS